MRSGLTEQTEDHHEGQEENGARAMAMVTCVTSVAVVVIINYRRVSICAPCTGGRNRFEDLGGGGLE